MAFEMQFQDSEISQVKLVGTDLEIHFGHAKVIATDPSEKTTLPEGSSVPAIITIGSPKYKKLPIKGKLEDGELYGIAGKSLNGRVPVDFKCEYGCELELSINHIDYVIQCKSLKIAMDIKF